MFKRTKTSEISFFTFIIFISVFCFLLDLICSVLIGVRTMGDGSQTANGELQKLTLEVALYNQFTFYSIWVLFVNIVYSIYRIVLNDRKYVYGTKMQEGHWSDVIIILINMVAFTLYALTLITAAASNTQGLVNGSFLDYQIVKSTLEHFIMPIVILVYLFVFARFQINLKEFIVKRSWYPAVGVAIYAVYVIVLFAVNQNFVTNPHMIDFPYGFISPGKIGYSGTISLAIVAVGAHFGLTVGLAWAYNAAADVNLIKFNDHFNTEIEDEKIEA